MPSFNQIRAVLTDIEGTTTDIRFVHDVLFPYAKNHMDRFVRANAEQPEVEKQLIEVAKIAGCENDNLDKISEALQQWMKKDLKLTPLKTLQGMLWKTGYEQGDFKGHIYPDASLALSQWHQQGLQLAVYSSGSVQAQKLLYANSTAGDLTPLFSGYFDTTTGPKRLQESYQSISNELSAQASSILFLSDIVEELDAAKAAGLQTCQLVRDDDMQTGQHPTAESFNQIEIH